MKTFLDYCCEANARGSDFEIAVAKNVQKWIELNNLAEHFSAERFQTVSEDDGNRNEDYSDVIIRDLQNDSEFFLECKKSIRDNILTTQFNMTDDCHLIPVKKAGRVESKSPHLRKLAEDIESTPDWQEFSEFLRQEKNGLRLIDWWNDKSFIDQDSLHDSINQYNALVDEGHFQSNVKKFEHDVIREDTQNQLYVALQWRISDVKHTWDVCHLRDISYFGQLIRDHYMYGKAGEVKYIQIGTNCFKFEDDPLSTTCLDFPEVNGQFDLKFTPRFGTGSMYMTPRAKCIEDVSSNFTFKKDN